jgi:hypothetical protein
MSGDQFQRDVTQGLPMLWDESSFVSGNSVAGAMRSFPSPLLRYSLPDKSALDDRPVEFRSINS